MSRRCCVTATWVLMGLSFFGTAWAAPPISWDPHRLDLEIGSGILEPVEVTLRSGQALEDLTVEVVPELEPFLSILNPTIASLERGGEYTVRLSLYVPPETPEGVYDGVLRVRRGRRTVARPLPVEVTVDYAGAVVAPDTRVLSRQAGEKVVEVSPDGRILTFGGVDAELREIAPPDVLVVPASELLPNGFLGRVVTVTEEDGRLVVVTEPAALTEVVSSANIEVDFELGAEAIVGAQTVSKAALTPKGLFEPIEVPVEAVLFDLDHDLTTTDDQVRATGGLTLSPDVTLSLEIDDGEVEEFSLGAMADARTSLAVEAELEATFEREVEVARFRFRPIVFWVGWAPVYLQPVLAFSVDVSAEAGGELTVGAQADAAVEVAIVYDGTEWSTLHDSSLELSAIGPTLDVSAQVEGRAGPELTVLLYGVVGPELQLSGFARLDAELGRCPFWWELTGGLSLDAAIDMGPFSEVVAGPSYPGLISLEELLAQAEECRNDGGDGDGGGGGSALEERIFFASDRGGDFDIWSIAPDGSDLQLIVEGPGNQTHPAVSPKGRQLAYLDGATGKWTVLDLDDGSEVVLDGSGHTGNYEWSSDGSAIVGSVGGCSNAIRHYPLTGGTSLLLNEGGRDTLWGVDWTTGKLFYSNDPCWSPFIKIKSFDPTTGTSTVLQGSDGRSEGNGNVSRDGQWLTYAKADFSFTGPHRIHVISTAGGAETQLSSPTGSQDTHPHFSPDGTRVVFSRKIDGVWNLWVVGRDGSGEQPLLEDEPNNLHADWAEVVVREGST